MRYARRTDANHQEIRDGLRAVGWDVEDCSGIGGGVGDLVATVYPKTPHFLEVKDGKKPPSARKLTKKQVVWAKYCGAITSTVTSLEEAIEALERARAMAIMRAAI